MKVSSFCLLLALPLLAQQPPDSRLPPSIRTSAEGSVFVKPDQAILDIGVVTQAQTAQMAGSQNATKLDAVLAALKKAAGTGAEIKTIGYSLNPDWRYPGERGGKPTIAGYTAHNVVQVKTGDLAGVGKLIDAALGAGANNVQRLQFTLKDEQPARAEALRQAAVRARADAEALAAALGLKIARVLYIEEGGPGPIRPMDMAMPRMAAMAEAAPPTPVEPGTIEVRQSVTLTVAIAP